MRNILKSTVEVCHFWANDVQPSGRAGNVFFEDSKIYSYGRHFCIARRLPSNVVVFTLSGYSNSTAKHKSRVLSAAIHLKRVYCNDPDASALSNKESASATIRAALDNAEKPRLRQTTRDGYKAVALEAAEQFNEYLHALPADERANVSRFDVTGLAHIREVMIANELAARKAKEEKQRLADIENAERLEAWRTDRTIRTDGFWNLPVMLRLGYFEQYKGEAGYQIIETSKGANIPVSFASRLWRLISAAKATGQSMENVGAACGHYVLNTVRADGSIVVGCHDIPYSELERIAHLLGFVVVGETV